jgi:hypothetical protein
MMCGPLTTLALDSLIRRGSHHISRLFVFIYLDLLFVVFSSMISLTGCLCFGFSSMIFFGHFVISSTLSSLFSSSFYSPSIFAALHTTQRPKQRYACFYCPSLLFKFILFSYPNQLIPFHLFFLCSWSSAFCLLHLKIKQYSLL